MWNGTRKVLIVDDEPVIRRLLSQRLSREGCLCTEADSAEAALRQLGAGSFDAMFLDIRMPGRTGVELLTDVRYLYPDLAIIMATAVNDVSIAVDCIRRGADDYVCKPFDLEEVSLTLKRAIEKKHLQQEIRRYQRLLEDRVEAQTAEIRRLFLGAIESLVAALEAKDRYTAGHSRRVAEIAVAIGNELGLSEDEKEDLRWGGLLHDVGKIAVDQMVQNKPGRLTREEYEHIMIHAHVGAGIVRAVVNERVVQMILHHHDHFDGRGLHQVTTGTGIPLAARVLTVADSYDAMTSERPYRAAMPAQDALEEIKRCTGTQFDPAVVAAFLKAVGAGVTAPESVVEAP